MNFHLKRSFTSGIHDLLKRQNQLILIVTSFTRFDAYNSFAAYYAV